MTFKLEKNLKKFVKQLCAPAYIYFILSALSLTLLAIQNFGDNTVYCVGCLSCNVTSVLSIFLTKSLYVLFWTWLLNRLCKMGLTNVSWFLVLFPFVLYFVAIGLFLLQNMHV